MAIKTYKFYEAGSIPGVPGTFNAGQVVDVDEDTNEVIDERMMGEDGHEDDDAPSLPLDTSPEKVQRPIFADPFAQDLTPEEGG